MMRLAAERDLMKKGEEYNSLYEVGDLLRMQKKDKKK